MVLIGMKLCLRLPQIRYFFTDGQNFQDKLNNNTLKGPQGDKGLTGSQGPMGPTGPAGINATTTNIATSTSDGLMSSTLFSKLSGIQAGAEVNVQSDWTTTSVALSSYIFNKPDIRSGNGAYSILIGYYQNIKVSGINSVGQGESVSISGNGSCAFGAYLSIYGDKIFAEGMNNISYGTVSHIEGIGCYIGTTAYCSHVGGYFAKAFGPYSHCEGYGTYTDKLSKCAHAEGYGCIAQGPISHVQNYNCTTVGYYSHASGYYTTADGYAQTVIGQYNVQLGTSNSIMQTDPAFIIGNGSYPSTRSNAFRVTWGGQTYAKGAYSSTGADYAEFFEWADGNPNNEERIGYFVTFDNDTEKIRKANSTDDYILGVVSVDAAIIGDNYDEDWKNKYVRDKWGRIKYEKVVINEAEYDEDGNILVEETSIESPILSSDYDDSIEYIPRRQRKEWDAIGLLGKLLVYDDGTCEVGKYCMPNDNGIATKSNTGYRVLKKMDGLVKILLK